MANDIEVCLWLHRNWNKVKVISMACHMQPLSREFFVGPLSTSADNFVHEVWVLIRNGLASFLVRKGENHVDIR
jgi:hypothetical protein